MEKGEINLGTGRCAHIVTLYKNKIIIITIIIITIIIIFIIIIVLVIIIILFHFSLKALFFLQLLRYLLINTASCVKMTNASLV